VCLAKIMVSPLLCFTRIPAISIKVPAEFLPEHGMRYLPRLSAAVITDDNSQMYRISSETLSQVPSPMRTTLSLVGELGLRSKPSGSRPAEVPWGISSGNFCYGSLNLQYQVSRTGDTSLASTFFHLMGKGTH